MTTIPAIDQAFTPSLIGQTEKALKAILNRLLAGTGVSEPQWIALAVAADGSIEKEALIGRVARALKVDEMQAAERVDELLSAGLLGPAAADKLEPTEDGTALQARVHGQVAEITERMWGDQPAEDLATAARVLSAILTRADAELERL